MTTRILGSEAESSRAGSATPPAFQRLDRQLSRLQRFLVVLVVIIALLPASVFFVLEIRNLSRVAGWAAEQYATQIYFAQMRGNATPAAMGDLLRHEMALQGHTFLRVRDDRGHDLIWLGNPRRSAVPNTQVRWLAAEARPYREVFVQVDERPLLVRAARVLGVHLLVAAILAFLVYQIPMRALRHAIGEVENSHAQLVHSDRLSSIGEMYAGLAHEVNNPLGIMLTRVQLLIDGAGKQGLPAETVAELELVQRHGQRIAEIIRGLLAFARRTSTDMRPASLNAVLGDACSLLERAFAKQNITIERVLDPGLPEIVASPDQLLQVFVNLLTNSRDAMPEGGIIVVRSHRAPGGVVAEVQDSGLGIDDESMGRLFEPFFTTKDVGKGTGLGLAVSYGIVRAHKGDIEVRSAPGEGALFRVFLPAHGGHA